jgi:chromate transporter
MVSEANTTVAPQVGLPRLLFAFGRLGAVTFGGSLQSWIHRELVERLGWMDNREFLSGMSMAQVLPGANPVNIAVYVGLKLCGGMGAVAAVLGLVAPAFCMILVLGELYRRFGHLGAVHFVLGGLAAAGVGATLTMGVKLGRRLHRDVGGFLTAAGVFVLIGVLRLPMLPVLLAAVPLSVGWAFVADAKAPHGS